MPNTAPTPKADKPHYHGHRDRLRQRFVDGGADALADYELLELVLFMAIPRRDVKPLAKDLIARFDNFAGVVNAPLHALLEVENITENAAIALKSIQSAAHRMLKQDVLQKPVLNSWARLLDYLSATMAHEQVEHFRILYMNKRNILIADEIFSRGTIDYAPAYPREIIKRALDLGATAMILVHNHPSGDSTPSQMDADMTYAIRAAGEPFKIAIHDHLIVSRNSISSMKNLGLIR